MSILFKSFDIEGELNIHIQFDNRQGQVNIISDYLGDNWQEGYQKLDPSYYPNLWTAFVQYNNADQRLIFLDLYYDDQLKSTSTRLRFIDAYIDFLKNQHLTLKYIEIATSINHEVEHLMHGSVPVSDRTINLLSNFWICFEAPYAVAISNLIDTLFRLRIFLLKNNSNPISYFENPENYIDEDTDDENSLESLIEILSEIFYAEHKNKAAFVYNQLSNNDLVNKDNRRWVGFGDKSKRDIQLVTLYKVLSNSSDENGMFWVKRHPKHVSNIFNRVFKTAIAASNYSQQGNLAFYDDFVKLFKAKR